MSFESLLTQTCTIQTESTDYTTAGDGSLTNTWSDTYENVPCRLINSSGNLVEGVGGYDKRVSPYIFLKITETISVGNRIVHDNGYTYLVTYIYVVEDFNDSHHYKIFLKRQES